MSLKSRLRNLIGRPSPPAPVGTDATTRILGLHGAVIQHTPDAKGWSDFFRGEVGIERVDDRGGVVVFDLILPTAELDKDDYIFTREQMAGTTDKVILTQGGHVIDGSRIIGISKSQPGGRPVIYRLTVELPKSALNAVEALEIRMTWQGRDVAVAVAS